MEMLELLSGNDYAGKRAVFDVLTSLGTDYHLLAPSGFTQALLLGSIFAPEPALWGVFMSD
ncbi:MAG: hypothetical protein ACOYIP_06180 [Coriobacteriales bacterium]